MVESVEAVELKCGANVGSGASDAAAAGGGVDDDGDFGQGSVSSLGEKGFPATALNIFLGCASNAGAPEKKREGGG